MPEATLFSKRAAGQIAAAVRGHQTQRRDLTGKGQERELQGRHVRLARTTTDEELCETYPTTGNVFLVELGESSFTEEVGSQAIDFTPYGDEETRELRWVRTLDGGYLTESAVVSIELHHGQWYALPARHFAGTAKLSETLLPGFGTSAEAKLMTWSQVDGTYVETGGDIEIFDAFDANFGLAGEYLPIQLALNGRFEIIGSQGLLRLAVTEEEIAGGFGGDVKIIGPTPQVTVTGAFKHFKPPGVDAVPNNTDIWIRYFSGDGGEWTIMGRACEANS